MSARHPAWGARVKAALTGNALYPMSGYVVNRRPWRGKAPRPFIKRSRAARRNGWYTPDHQANRRQEGRRLVRTLRATWRRSRDAYASMFPINSADWADIMRPEREPRTVKALKRATSWLPRCRCDGGTRWLTCCDY